MKTLDVIANNILITDLQSEDFHTRWFAAEVLGTKRDLTSEQINSILKIAETSDVGEVLLWGLGMMKAKGTEDFIGTFLEHENNYYRWRAVEALRDLRTPKAVKILKNYLKDSRESETRWKCAWALGEIGNMDSFENLWYAAEHDPDGYVRWKSVWGISCLRGDVETLVKNKFEQEPLSDFMAWRSAWILGRIGDRKTLEWLKSMKLAYGDSKYIKYQISLAIDAINNRRQLK